MCYLKGIFDNQMIILLNMNLEGIKGCHMGEGGVKIAKKMPCGLRISTSNHLIARKSC